MKIRLLGIAVNALLLVSLAFWLVTLATPSTEAARLRNALIAEVGVKSDFDWLPGHAPDSYKQETLEPTNYFKNVHQQIFKEGIKNLSEYNKIIRIAEHLLQVKKAKGGGILSDTVTAYEGITQQGTGYCADFTQVINAMAKTENIPVREWGMAFDGFGGWGHAFNEIYDSQLKKWIFLDVFNSFYVRSKSSGELLSVLEFRERLLRDPEDIKIIPIVKSRFGFKDRDHLLEYFDRGKNQFYLWWGNNIFSYEHNPIVKLTGKISRSLEQLTAIAIGIHPRIKIIKTKKNEKMIEDLLSLKVELITIAFAGCLLGILLVFQIWNTWQYFQKHKAA